MTFSWAASYPASRQRQTRVQVVQYGDGYEQRIAEGVHPGLSVWQMTFTNVTDSTRDAIRNFLQARETGGTFSWEDPEGATGTYVCDSYNISRTNHNASTITATFRQVRS